jgi:pyruvate, orthophosphate dikinase
LNTRAWAEWQAHGLSERLRRSVAGGIQVLEMKTGRRFGAGPDPLLVAVRTSATVAVPALQPATLNIGFSGGTNAWDQLMVAITAAFDSWTSDRAKRYRKLNRVPDGAALAVVIQVMVSPTADQRSAAGRVHTRNPADGSDVPMATWITGIDQQGEERPLSELAGWDPSVAAILRDAIPIVERLERHPQTVEFVVERGELHIIQTSDLDVGPLAAARIYLDMAGAGILNRAETVARLTSLPLDDLEHDELVSPGPCLATGTGASPGIASGICVRDAADAAARAAAGIDVVLVRSETSPRDVFAMKTARAIVTERGGEISHAAIFSREYGIPCAVGCGDLCSVDDGAELTVNGSTGEVFLGRLAPVRTTPPAVAEARAFLAGHPVGGTR